MRAAVLWTLVAIGVAVFVTMFVSVWRHHTQATTPLRRAAVEYVWQVIPCLIVALCAAPAVHRVLVDLNN